MCTVVGKYFLYQGIYFHLNGQFAVAYVIDTAPVWDLHVWGRTMCSITGYYKTDGDS